MINEWPNNNHKQSKHETHTNIYQVYLRSCIIFYLSKIINWN